MNKEYFEIHSAEYEDRRKSSVRLRKRTRTRTKSSTIMTTRWGSTPIWVATTTTANNPKAEKRRSHE